MMTRGSRLLAAPYLDFNDNKLLMELCYVYIRDANCQFM